MKWRTVAVAIVVGLLAFSAIPAAAQTAIVGTEKLGWDQQASSTTDLASMKWMCYVDSLDGVVVQNTNCGTVAGTDGYPCTGAVPAMTPGEHSIRLTAFYEVSSTKVESPKSDPPLLVRLVVAPTAPINPKIIRE